MSSEVSGAGYAGPHLVNAIRRRAMAQLLQEVDPDEVGLDHKALDRLDQHFAHYVDVERLPGDRKSVV